MKTDFIFQFSLSP